MWIWYQKNKNNIKFYTCCLGVGMCIGLVFGMLKIWLISQQAVDFMSIVMYGGLAWVLSEVAYKLYKEDEKLEKNKIH